MKTIVWLFCIIVLSLFVSGAEYADLRIDVSSDGFVTIGGDTNAQQAILGENFAQYTSKQGSTWILNFTTTDVFESAIYELRLPKGSQITYIKTVGTIRIDENLVMIGSVRNNPITIVVQYQIIPVQKKVFGYSWMSWILGILFATLGFIILFKSRQETKKQLQNYVHLPDRQKEIMTLLVASDGKMYQSQLEKKIDIPKSSLSRNLHSLERNGFISIKPSGMSNYIEIIQKDAS